MIRRPTSKELNILILFIFLEITDFEGPAFTGKCRAPARKRTKSDTGGGGGRKPPKKVGGGGGGDGDGRGKRDPTPKPVRPARHLRCDKLYSSVVNLCWY